MRGGKTSLVVIAFGTALMLALAGSYARAQTTGEYAATVNGAGVAAEQGGSGELAGAPDIGSPLDVPSALDSGNDPLSEAPSYFGDSGNGSSGMAENLSQPSQDSSGVPYAPTVQ